jgi:hypothetical protein
VYRRTLAVFVVALAALIFVLPASAGWNRGASIELLDLGGSDQMVDAGNDGFGPGDMMIISHTLLVNKGSWPGATGTLNASLLVLPTGLAKVTARMRLPAGMLAVSGQFSLETGPTAPFSVTGAGGSYSGLAGQMTISDSGGLQQYSITLTSQRGHGPLGNWCSWGSQGKRAGLC